MLKHRSGFPSFLRYIYTWKCHRETPFATMLNKQRCHIFIKENGGGDEFKYDIFDTL
jgi:hypothetical protein